jgi:hypothetical protein
VRKGAEIHAAARLQRGGVRSQRHEWYERLAQAPLVLLLGKPKLDCEAFVCKMKTPIKSVDQLEVEVYAKGNSAN